VVEAEEGADVVVGVAVVVGGGDEFGQVGVGL
jgi:hypothetical protein